MLPHYLGLGGAATPSLATPAISRAFALAFLPGFTAEKASENALADPETAFDQLGGVETRETQTADGDTAHGG